jgi:hypothetical protein
MREGLSSYTPCVLRFAGLAFLVLASAVSCGDPAEPDPTRTLAIVEATPTSRVTPHPATIEPSLPPTSTWTPPNPESITPLPTAPPVTEEPRPRMPAADDIKLGDNGKYYADVDGCRWDEYGTFDIGGVEEVAMQTPCLPQEGLHYIPATGEVAYFIQ